MSKYSSYILFFLISILVVILYLNDFSPLQNMQRSVNDMLCGLTAESDTRPNVVLVTIDRKSQNDFGDWPWHHDLIADLAAAVGGGQPKAVVIDAELFEDSKEDSAGNTAILAEQLTWINNVVLPYDIAMATFKSSKTSNPKELFNSAVTIDNQLGEMDDNSSLLVHKVFLPAGKLLAAKPKLGFDLLSPDDDRTLRYQPMVMNFEGYYYPSLPLIASAAYLGIPPDQIRVTEGKEIRISGQRTIPINGKSEFFINYSKESPFTQFSAADVLGEKFDYSVFKNKLVVIGVDDPDSPDLFKTTVSETVPKYVIKGTVMENIINGNILSVREKTGATELALMFILGAFGAFVLPRISLLYRMVVLVGALFVLANINYFMVSSFQTLPESVYFLLQIVLFMLASPLIESQILTGQLAKPGADPKKLPKAKIERTPRSETIGNIPVREITAKANETSEQKTVAMAPAEEFPPDHQTINLDDNDIPTDSKPVRNSRDEFQGERIEAYKAESNNDELIKEDWTDSTRTRVSGSGELSISGDLELKSLGRYQVTGVLGKGAMGTVYKGIDPAINRPVALKTIRLDFINDPAEFEELKERLYREAQAAGKLSHPNIVTIYDVGSEGPLQYIAMEYLEGQTLENLIKKKVKFNYKIIAQIITQICQAMEYAHERGIVHRDIKPANIMVLSDYRVKVMDFGIARIDSNSMTKTGIAMGTPNYISPEQLRGLAIDRRADLFSLGVVMYEMLLGKRPFKGENITSLIYSIMNHEPEKPSQVNPQVPLLFDHIVTKALKKVPAERYQKASDVMADLHDFVGSFTTK